MVANRRLRYGLVVLAVGLSLVGCTADTSAPPTPPPGKVQVTPSTPPATVPNSAYDTAKTRLGTLQVKGKAPKTGYSRDEFYKSWTTKNYCSTAEVILHRDLRNVTEGTDCRVATGILRDPYTGEDIAYEPGGVVQIDHVVAIGNAWVTGAKYWSPELRKAYANDPMVLLAVSGRQNAIKQDSDAAEWLPPNKAYRCDYVAKQIEVKFIYKLWVTQAEKQAMADVLAKC